jgi:DNA-binding LytR/AlgR family response regulator
VRLLIVDDEAPARRRLARQIQELGGHTIVGQAADGDEALELCEALEPDALLLDIHMPKLDGLSLVSQYRALPPTVFVTAYDSHAVRAFELHAVDYLLKPVRAERLAEALARAQLRIGSVEAAPRVLQSLAPSSTRIASASRGMTRLFDALTVTRFWSSEKYTLFRADGEEHMTEEALGAIEVRLAPHGFLRVHRAELVRLSAVRAIRSEDDGVVLALEDGQRARVSRRSSVAVRAALGL